MSADELEAQLLKQAFQAVDTTGQGKFKRSDLCKVFKELDSWSQDDLDQLMDAVDTKKDGFISYSALVDYIMDDGEDDEPGAGGEDDEDDEHNDCAKLANYKTLGGHGLDLNLQLNKEDFFEVLRHLDVDANESEAIFNEVVQESNDAGFDTQDGIKVKWFLDELHIERKDQESLAHLEEAIKQVRAGKTAPEGNGEHAITISLARLATLTEDLGRKAEEAWDVMNEHHILSQAGQATIVQTYENDKAGFVKVIEEYMVSPPLLPSSAGQTANREHCKAKVDEHISRCRTSGTKFVDADWDLLSAPNECLYVDKEKPGWDCTVAVPAGYKRLSELFPNAVLFKGGANPGDIQQGQIGTCFLLGALGAVAANKKDAIRRAFIAFDIELGIYGVRFCINGEWEHIIVDDIMPVDKHNRLLYARSKEPDEVWCPILEKAFCKLHTCYEMCDGGKPSQAIFSVCGGTSGMFAIEDQHKKDPTLYWTILDSALNRGWLLTTTFVIDVSKVLKAGVGKCGEAVLPTGLVGGHVYSVLRIVEACGVKLICCRNPWGTGEWKGKYSDDNKDGEWTAELTEATGWTNENNGQFWMSIQDFVDNSGGVEYARTFNPQWKKITQRSRFQTGSLLATSSWAYTSRENNELGFEKGATLEVKDIAPGWWFGNVAGAPDVTGFFPANYVKLKDRPVARFDLSATPYEGKEDVDLVINLMQPNSKMQRKFYQRKDNGMNYKDVSYPNIQLIILGPDGKVALKRTGKKRCISGELSLVGGAGVFRVFALSLDGRGDEFTLRCYVKDGSVTLAQIPGATIADVTKAITG